MTSNLLDSLLDSPSSVYAMLAAAELILLALWRTRRSRALLWSMAGPIVLAAAMALLGHYLITDRQQIILQTRQLASDIEQGRYDDACQCLDDAFRGPEDIGAVDKTLAQETLVRVAKSMGLSEIRLRRLDVEVAGATATMHAQTILTFSQGKFPLAWDVQWVKRGSTWKILELLHMELDRKVLN